MTQRSKEAKKKLQITWRFRSFGIKILHSLQSLRPNQIEIRFLLLKI
jgi:hypothetical protein